MVQVIWGSRSGLSIATGQSKQNVGKYIALASLPDYIITAFRDPRVLSLRWSTDLTGACATRGAVLQILAEELAKRVPAPSPEAVFAELTASVSKRKSGSRASESIKDAGQLLFEFSARDGRYGIRLGKQVDKRLRKPLQKDLKEWLKTWLKERSPGSAK